MINSYHALFLLNDILKLIPVPSNYKFEDLRLTKIDCKVLWLLSAPTLTLCQATSDLTDV